MVAIIIIIIIIIIKQKYPDVIWQVVTYYDYFGLSVTFCIKFMFFGLIVY